MTPTECYGCKYYIKAHMGGSGPEGEYIPAECAIHARFIEDCKDKSYDTFRDSIQVLMNTL